MSKSLSEEDPTCVFKLLDEFKPSGHAGRRSNLIENKPSALAPTRLLFDSVVASAVKKRKHTESSISPPTEKFNEDFTETSASPWNIRKLKADYIQVKADNANLQSQIQKLHTLRMEMELLYESEKSFLQKQQEHDKETIKALEEHMKTLRKREQECKEELTQCRKSVSSNKIDLEKKIFSLQKENTELKDQIKEVTLSLHNESTTGNLRLSKLEAELSLTLEEVAVLKRNAETLEKRAGEVTTVEEQLQLEQQRTAEANQRIKELENELENGKEAVATAEKHLLNLKRLPELEQKVNSLKEENKNLRDAVHNKLILEEEVMDLRSRHERFEEREIQLAHLEAAKQHLETVLEQWHKLAQDHCVGVSPKRAVTGPELLRIRIENLQENELAFTSDKAQLECKLKSAEHARDSLTAELEKATKQAEKLQTINEQQSNVIKRLQKKLLLVSRERDSYRSQLDMYEKDLTITSTAALLNSQQQQQKLRIEALEKAVEGYHELVQRLETDLEKSSKTTGGTQLMNEKIEKLEEERNTLRQQNDELMKRRDELELELEYRALKGDFNPMKTKVVHFRLNPAAEAETKRENEVLKLQQECDKLRERLKLIQEGETEDITRQVNVHLAASNSQEVQELKEQLKSCDLKNQRLKEVFNTTRKEFRELVYMVLGYRIDLVKPKLYRLSNMYAESEDDHLLFQFKDDNPQLLETPYSATLSEMISEYLERQHSIPMFLSAITTELFNQQSMYKTQSVLVE